MERLTALSNWRAKASRATGLVFCTIEGKENHCKFSTEINAHLGTTRRSAKTAAIGVRSGFVSKAELQGSFEPIVVRRFCNQTLNPKFLTAITNFPKFQSSRFPRKSLALLILQQSKHVSAALCRYSWRQSTTRIASLFHNNRIHIESKFISQKDSIATQHFRKLQLCHQSSFLSLILACRTMNSKHSRNQSKKRCQFCRPNPTLAWSHTDEQLNCASWIPRIWDGLTCFRWVTSFPTLFKMRKQNAIYSIDYFNTQNSSQQNLKNY